MGRREQQADRRPDRLHQDVLRQAHAAQHPDPVLRLRRRPQAAGDAAVPDRRRPSGSCSGSRPRPTTSSSARIAAGGYVWHTTGSGKTLTSFKAAQLASQAARASTRCCSSSTARTSTTRPCGSTTGSRRARSTRTSRRSVLKRQLEDPDARIIVTTIQKLARFVEPEQGPRDLRRARRADLRRVPPQPVRRHAHRDHEGVQALPPVRLHRHADLRRERRHRRQSAAAHHRAGVRRPAAHLHDRRRDQRQERAAVPASTTSTRSSCRPTSPTSRSPRSTPSGRCSRPERIGQVVGYILEHFDQKTKRNSTLHAWRASGVAGFNSMFATASIDAAKRYYAEFAQAAGGACPEAQRLKIGLIYSYAANEDDRRRHPRRRRSSRPTTSTRARATSSSGAIAGLQRDVRHELRHLVRQVPELLQGPVAAAEEPRARPRRSSSTCS